MSVAEHHWEAQCVDCPVYKVRYESADIDESIFPLMDTYLIVHGGAPIGLDDLEPMQWMTLGIIREEKEAIQWRMSVLSSELGALPGQPSK